MTHWVDVRVPAVQTMDAILALRAAFGPLVHIDLDENPPAAGPEEELQIRDETLDEVSAALAAGGVSVLAIRPRLEL